MKFIKELNELKALNLNDLEQYSLINNYGFIFTINGLKYDLRHVLNVYGAETDFWTLTTKDKEIGFDTFEEVLETLKELSK